MAEDVTYRPATTAAVPALPKVSGATADDWAVQATDAIVKVVGTAHDKITGPALQIAKYIIYGLFAALLGTGLGVLAVIVSFRLWNNYLPESLFGENHMWVVYLGHGVVFFVAGWFVWRMRRPRPAED